MPDVIGWSDEMLNAFGYLEYAMITSTGLGIPDYAKMFYLYARDKL